MITFLIAGRDSSFDGIVIFIHLDWLKLCFFVVSVSQRIHGDEVDFLNGNCMVNVPLPWMRNGEQWNNLYGYPTTDHMIIYICNAKI